MTLAARPVLMRYALAALTAWLLPSYAVLAAMAAEDWLAGRGAQSLQLELVTLGPFMGLFFGWPCFLLGGVAWAVLHRAGKARPAYAALIGGSAPLLPIGYLMVSMRGPGEKWTTIIGVPLVLTIVAIGAVTGLAVWRIAYPRTAAVS